MTTPTPRTDKLAYDTEHLPITAAGRCWQLCRELERELTASQAQLAAANKTINWMRSETWKNGLVFITESATADIAREALGGGDNGNG